jgi:hypothetical protein
MRGKERKGQQQVMYDTVTAAAFHLLISIQSLLIGTNSVQQ